jgi:diguanylate cyclase
MCTPSTTLSGPEGRAVFLELVGAALHGLSNDQTFVVMALDLDHFSELTVARGDATAALVLSEMAHRLRQRLSRTDVILWSAGDLFVVACAVTDSPRQLEALQGQMFSCIETPFLVANAPIFLSASMGVAFSTGARDDRQQLLGSAEVARSQARRAGGHRLVVFDRSARSRLCEEFELTQALHWAIEHRELAVEYQPIVKLASKTTEGFEASLRWQPRGRDLVPPEVFLPLAEESGLIGTFGSWLFDEVLRHWAGWTPPKSGVEAPWLAVSISLAHLDASFAGFSDDLFETARALPGRLAIEISERELCRNPEGVGAMLTWLKALGVRVIVNNVGRSSSLLSWRTFPVDALKIDRRFTDHVEDNERDQVIVTSIIELAHTLGIVAIAEGVTREAQFNCLDALSCDLVQGPYLSAPAPFDDVQAAHAERLWIGSSSPRLPRSNGSGGSTRG